jgi:NAD(P)-dependent dehydrogenase (short-subunit alcohol dehydrogenase family)
MVKKKILITGASGAIGAEVIKSLESSEWKILATYNSTTPNEDLTKMTNCRWVKVDLGNPILSSDFIDALSDVNCFIHLAAVTEVAKVEQIKSERLDRMFRINVISAIEIISYILPNMIQHKFGRLIFCGSIVGKQGSVGLSAYSATKSSLEGLTKSINKEFQLLKKTEAELNVSVVTLRAGFTDTPMTGSLKDSIKAGIIRNSVMDRFLYPSEIASQLRTFLDEKSFILSGSILDVNGGQTL